MLKSYRPLLSVPHLPGLFLWSLAARLNIAGLPIGITFLVADWTGSYALAGAVSTTLTVGAAVAGPLRGRSADRGRTDRLMAVCGLCYGTGLVVLALLPAPLWWLSFPLALATGLFTPPASQVGRALWPHLTSGRTRTAMYAAESTFQELVFVVGPLVAAAAVGVGGGRGAVLLIAVVTVAGSAGFALAIRRAGLATPPRPATGAAPLTGRRRSLLLQPELGLLVAVCMLLIAGLAAVDLVIVAWARELGRPGIAGALAAIWSVGSLVGGLVAGGLAGPPRISRRAFAAAAGTVLLVPLLPPVLVLPTPWLLAPVLFVAGLAIAPTLAAATERISDVAPNDRRAEAFGWMNTGITTGVAASAPLTGWLVDGGGPALGVVGGAAMVLGAAVLTLGVGRTPRRCSDPVPAA
ncbi:MFS transporter [Thermobifida halotolerans]|uniref:MFS transporter n=1 Tax=Thermobifida halotolerans TaxID=483545 RepID=UPI000AAC9B5C|nr:MFS transporter [Thermobifida halotolerans]